MTFCQISVAATCLQTQQLRIVKISFQNWKLEMQNFVLLLKIFNCFHLNGISSTKKFLYNITKFAGFSLMHSACPYLSVQQNNTFHTDILYYLARTSAVHTIPNEISLILHNMHLQRILLILRAAFTAERSSAASDLYINVPSCVPI